MSTFDPTKIREDFPIFSTQPNLHYLDSAATALKPKAMLDALNEYYTSYSANVHRGVYEMSERATTAYEDARQTVADFIHASSSKEIIFTSGTTASINLVALSWLKNVLKRGEEIVVTTLEHHSNIVPWQMLAKELGAKVIFWEPKKDGTIDPADATKYLTRQTKLLAITHVSNVLGTLTPLRHIIQQAYARGVRVLVDAAQSAPRVPLDVQYLDCDFLAFSGHKLYGPTGIGVLYVKEKHFDAMKPLFGGGGMIREVNKAHATWNEAPFKFEAGTPPIAEAIGLAASIKYVKTLGLSKIHDYEKNLTNICVAEMQKIPGVQILGPNKEDMHESIISFVVEGVHAHDVATILNDHGVAVRAGHHCCMPLHTSLKVTATARVSFGMYNNEGDIEALVKGLHAVKKVFKV